MEQHIVAWLSAHPFWRSEILLILGAWSGLAKADWDAFKEYKLGDPTATFSWTVACWKYSHALLIAGLPPIVAEIWRILNAATPVVSTLVPFL